MIKPEILKTWGPGGWIFYEPATNWTAPGPLENSFDQQVKNIIAMRQANPRFNLPTDEAAVAADLEAFTEARWAKTYSKAGMKKFRFERPEDKKKESSFTKFGRRQLAAVAALADIDTRALEEWLGAGGKPVTQELALQRAQTCAGCDGNQKHGWRELLTVPASLALKTYLAAKHHMNLETSLDEELGSCTACHCPLELKVWADIAYTKENTTPEQFARHAKTNPDCWVLNEP